MPMLFIRQKFDKVLVLLISAVGFCLLSYRPISSITPEMPKEFVDISSIGNRRQRLTEERVAKAYWDCVVNNIQWEYHYGSSLPQNPPQDFMPVRADVTTVDTATRTRYWRKLQEVWYLPTTWQKHYEWDTRWTTSWIDQVKYVGSWLYSRMSNARF